MIYVPRMRPSGIDVIKFFDIFRRKDERYITSFEKQFKEYIGSKDAITISSGRLGLYMIFKSYGLNKGDEIIISDFNFDVIANVVTAMGFVPIFCDIIKETHTIDPEEVRSKITKKTKAMIVTHIEGISCNMDELSKIAKKEGLLLVEDCAHSLGTLYQDKKTGSLGHAAIFSFGIGKQINTLGGGMITLNDMSLSHEIRKNMKLLSEQRKKTILKKYFRYKMIELSSRKKIFKLITWRFLKFFSKYNLTKKMFQDKSQFERFPKKLFYAYSSLQAYWGQKQLVDLDERISKKRKNVSYLSKKLDKKISFQKETGKSRSSFLHLVLEVKNRDEMKSELLKKGIDTQESWMCSCSNQPYFKKYEQKCSVSRSLEKKTLYIPINESLSEYDLDYIASSVNRIYKRMNKNS